MSGKRQHVEFENDGNLATRHSNHSGIEHAGGGNSIEPSSSGHEGHILSDGQFYLPARIFDRYWCILFFNQILQLGIIKRR